MANRSMRSPIPKAKLDANAKAKAITNHKGAAKPKAVAKPEGPKSKSKVAKSIPNAQNKSSRANNNATRNNPFVNNSSSGYHASPYGEYSANLSDTHGDFMSFSSAFNGHGSSDIDPYTNGVGDNAQNNYFGTGSGFSVRDRTKVNDIDQYGNSSFHTDINGLSNSYNDSISQESYVDAQFDDPKDKKVLGSNASGSVHIKHEKQEHLGVKNESDEDYVDLDKTPKTRKERQPRAKLLRWNDNDWKQLVLGIVWACGEAGISIPFNQAAQLVNNKCTAGALQQALLKLRVKQNAAGGQVPPLRMAWTRNKNGNDANNGDQTFTRGMVARRKPTRHQDSQTWMFTFKRAYVEEDRALLPFPYRYDPEGSFNCDVDIEVADGQGHRDSAYTPFSDEEEDILGHFSPKQPSSKQTDFHLNAWTNSNAMDTEAHERNYSGLTNTISTQLQEHDTTGLAGTLGSQFQEHSLNILTSPVSRQLLEKNHVDLTGHNGTHSHERDHAHLTSFFGGQFHEQGLVSLSNISTSPLSGDTSGLFLMDEHPRNQIVDIQPTNWDINGLPTSSSTGFSSIDFGLNDNANIPLMSIEHQPGDSSSPEYPTPTSEDWSKDKFDLGSNGQLGPGYGGQSFGTPFSQDFGTHSSQPFGHDISPDVNGVFSPTYNDQFGQGSGQSSQPFIGNFDNGFSGPSRQGSFNNTHHGFGEYATQGANTPTSQILPIDFQKNFAIPRTGRDLRNKFSAVNIKKTVVPRGSRAAARFM